MATAGHPVGAAHIQLWRVDASNRMAGTSTTPTSISNGTTVSAYKLVGHTGFDLAPAERTRIDLFSGDTVAGTVFFGADTAPTGTLSVETIDSMVLTMAEGGNTDTTTVSGWEIFGTSDMNPSPNTLGCCVSRQWQSRDSGTDGQMYWLNQIYLLQMSWTAPAAERSSKGTASISVAALSQTRFPNGVAFSSTQSFYDNKTKALKLVTSNPLAFTTFVADGAATEFTLGYLPISSTVTAATEPNYMAINGTETAPSAVNTTTGAVTLTAAGSAADFVSMMYATDFDAVP